MASKRLLTNFFPEPRFQLKFLALLTVGSLLQIAVAAGILYYFLQQNYSLLVLSQPDLEVQNVLLREFRILVVALSVNFVLFLVGTLAVGVVFSHRVAGPLFALKRALTAHLDGKGQPLRFRKNDEFQELAQLFNALMSLDGKAPAKKTLP